MPEPVASERRVTTKPQIVLSQAASASLNRIVDGKASAQPMAGASVADMLSHLHAVAAQLLSEMATADEPIAKRIAMAKDVAKLLPLLAKAERNVHKGWRNKDVEDMTDGELRRALKLAKAG